MVTTTTTTVKLGPIVHIGIGILCFALFSGPWPETLSIWNNVWFYVWTFLWPFAILYHVAFWVIIIGLPIVAILSILYWIGVLK